jgi:RHS repeat-associated protein
MHSVSLKFLVGILSFSDYYPFGMQMVGRNDPGDGYRYGFQGQETDDEITGSESHVAYTYRCHDARLGRFLSIDPLTPKYPSLTPYQFSSNNPIAMLEIEGLEGTWHFEERGEGDGGTKLVKVVELDIYIMTCDDMGESLNFTPGRKTSDDYANVPVEFLIDNLGIDYTAEGFTHEGYEVEFKFAYDNIDAFQFESVEEIQQYATDFISAPKNQVKTVDRKMVPKAIVMYRGDAPPGTGGGYKTGDKWIVIGTVVDNVDNSASIGHGQAVAHEVGHALTYLNPMSMSTVADHDVAGGIFNTNNTTALDQNNVDQILDYLPQIEK